MFANIKTFAIFAIILSSMQCVKKMSFDFNGRQADEVLMSHLHHLTRYDHSFEGQDKGTCGVLFDLAVEQYNNNMRNKNLLLITDELLESGNEFNQAECEHVSEGYTWVLLQVGDGERTCEIHVPLDLKNYEAGDSEETPLLNMHYALEAIAQGDSHCYNNQGETIMKTVITEAYTYRPPVTVTEVKYYDHLGNEINEEEYNQIGKKKSNEVIEDDLNQFRFFDKDGNGLTKEQFDKMNQELLVQNQISDSFIVDDKKTIQLPTINAHYDTPILSGEYTIDSGNQSPNKINTSLDESVDFSDKKSFHNIDTESEEDEHRFLVKPTGLLGSPKDCQHEDKLRVLDIYAAMITQKHTAGIVLYTENIAECLVRSERNTSYETILSVNDTECYFSVTVHQQEGDFEFTEENNTGLHRCEDLA